MKQVCIFLSGMVLGMIVMAFIFLTILDNRMEDLQTPIELSLEGAIAQMHYLLEDAKVTRRAVRECGVSATQVNYILRDCIDIGREETNMYNRMLMEIEENR